MPCMCGDPYCPSCGTAQGNYKCDNCGAWSGDGGCISPDLCRIAIDAHYDGLAAELEDHDALAQDYWNSLGPDQ